MFFLRLDLRGGRGRVPIDHTLVIGRSNTADLILDAPIISRVHCRICPRDEGLFLEDLGSATGTQRNGVPIHGPEPLVVGDIIGIGTFSFAIEDAQHRAAPQRRPALRPQRTSDDTILPADVATEPHAPVPKPALPPGRPPSGGLSSLPTADEILPPDLEATARLEKPSSPSLGLSPSATTVDPRPPSWSATDREAPSLDDGGSDKNIDLGVTSGKGHQDPRSPL